MIKFETINGTLCRMVEPTPLTPEATFPCVVRLIQDDSPMGRYNLKLRNTALEPLVVTGIAKDIGVVTHLVPRPHFSCECYEILGYPVEEGSHWWALWQAENGKSFEHKTAHHCRIFTMFSETELKVTNEEGEVVEFVDIDRFLSDGAKDGWQLYEPEPDYVICRRCGGSQSVPNPAVSNTAYTTCPKCGGTGYEIREQKPDDLYLNITPSNLADWCFDKKNFLVLVDDNFKRIVGENVTREQVGEIAKLLTEPAKEPEIVAHKQHANCLVCGKVIEGLLDGHATVSIKRYSISSLYESTYSHYCGKCFLELGFDKTERELRNRQRPIAEPEPEPKFAVGDWVEFNPGNNPKQVEIVEIDGDKLYYNTRYAGKTIKTHIYASAITRKLDPSEVIVRIGCLSGTVAPGCSDATIMIVPIGYNRFGDVAIVPVAMLDAPTRELVESLLKAQEEPMAVSTQQLED